MSSKPTRASQLQLEIKTIDVFLPFGPARIETTFSKYCKILIKYEQILTISDHNRPFSKRHVLEQQTKALAASLKRREWGFGIPIHTKMLLILINMFFIWININLNTL